MRDVEAVAEPARLHFNAAHIAISGCINGFIFMSAGLDVHAGMKMARTAFAEVAGKQDGDVEGIAEISLRVLLRKNGWPNGAKKKQENTKHERCKTMGLS